MDSKTVGDVVPAGFELVEVRGSDSCVEVLELLIRKNVLSAPVRDTATGKYVGSVDVLDLVALVVTMSEARELAEALSEGKMKLADFLARALEVFRSESVAGVVDASERNPWCVVASSTSLRTLFELFGSKANLHRVPVVNDADETISSIVSQSQLLKFIAEHLTPDSALGQMPADAIGGNDRALVTVTPLQTALEAFRLLLDKRVSGMPVVGADNELIASFSASDIKGSPMDTLFSDLYLRVLDYLIKCTASFYRENSIAPITCLASDTLHSVVQKMVKNHLHRIFLVDERRRVVDVISIADVVSAVLRAAN